MNMLYHSFLIAFFYRKQPLGTSVLLKSVSSYMEEPTERKID